MHSKRVRKKRWSTKEKKGKKKLIEGTEEWERGGGGVETGASLHFFVRNIM